MIARKETQYLRLDLDCPNEYPNLVGREFAWVAACELFEFGGHRCVLIRDRLESQFDILPDFVEDIAVGEDFRVVNRVEKHQALAGHFYCRLIRRSLLNFSGEVLALHGTSSLGLWV